MMLNHLRWTSPMKSQYQSLFYSFRTVYRLVHSFDQLISSLEENFQASARFWIVHHKKGLALPQGAPNSIVQYTPSSLREFAA
ncbi:hypothetical protein D3C78_990850 [compost metagenome]